MKLYLVRHGHPNYSDDCLTPLGVLHARAAAVRLADSGIEKIFSSSCGRAAETARVTADALGIEHVELLDFMREIPWGSVNGEELYANGHPWTISDKLASENKAILDENWQAGEYFVNNEVTAHSEKMFPQIDEFMAGLGCVRQGLYYRVGNCKNKTVALFSHAGASSVLVARLFNLPLPFVTSAIQPDFTAVTVINFPEGADCPVAPRFEIMNDARHIEGINAEAVFGR